MLDVVNTWEKEDVALPHETSPMRSWYVIIECEKATTVPQKVKKGKRGVYNFNIF